jgi:hypothetical protein
MSILLRTHKMLWGRSGNLCAFPDCRKELVMDVSETDDASIVGEEAHIVAQKRDGPRGESDLTAEQRNLYGNLILLCSAHHKVVDDHQDVYPVEKLTEMKRSHEAWVRLNLNSDLVKQKDDEDYSSHVDKFIELAEANEWKGWTSFVFSAGQPHIYQRNTRKLRELIEYIHSRIWPGRYPDLEAAFHNFKYVTNDFLRVFHKHMDPDRRQVQEGETEDDVELWTEKFYKISDWDPERYNQLLSKFEYHGDLVQDLCLEMTRAANHMFDMVRADLFRSFRISEGVLLVEMGPYENFSWKTVRTEYRREEKLTLYKGLRDFMTVRTSRSYHCGEGLSEDYFPSFD